MEISQLRVFSFVAREKNLTRAAARLFTSQPAISLQLKALEDELGTALFARSNKGMQVTPAGVELLPVAERILSMIEGLKHRAQEIKGELIGTIKIGTVSDSALVKLPEILAQFTHSFPTLSIQLAQGLSSDIEKRLVDGELDCAFIFGNKTDPVLITLPLLRVGLNIVGPVAWGRAIADAKWEDIVSMPWILPTADCSFRRVLEEAFDSSGHRPKAFIEAGEENTLRRLVETGVGLSVIRQCEAHSPAAEGRLVSWAGCQLTLQASFCYRVDHASDPRVNAFLSMVRAIWGVEDIGNPDSIPVARG